MEETKLTKHINSFVFQSYINNQSLTKNKSKAIVEKEYYFDLFFSFSKTLYGSIEFPKKILNYSEINVDGRTQVPQKTFWDFITLANFLKSSFRKVSLLLSFKTIQIDVNLFSVVCTLYFQSVITNAQEIIQVSFVGNRPQPIFFNDDTSSPSGSGQSILSPAELERNNYEDLFKLYKEAPEASQQTKDVSSSLNQEQVLSSNDLKILSAAKSIITNNPDNRPTQEQLTNQLQTTFNEPSKQNIEKSLNKPAVKENINKPVRFEKQDIQQTVAPPTKQTDTPPQTDNNSKTKTGKETTQHKKIK